MTERNGKLNPKALQLMALTFVAIHVPMVSLIFFGLISGFAGMLTIFLTVLVATMVSTAVTLYVMYRVFRAASAAQIPNEAAPLIA